MNVEPRIWWAYAFFAAIWPVWIIAAVAAGGLELLLPGVSEPIIGALATVTVILAFVAGVVGLLGYYEEAKTLRDRGGWAPTWWAWAAAHLLLTPFITGPVYLARRWQKVGLE